MNQRLTLNFSKGQGFTGTGIYAIITTYAFFTGNADSFIEQPDCIVTANIDTA